MISAIAPSSIHVDNASKPEFVEDSAAEIYTRSNRDRLSCERLNPGSLECLGPMTSAIFQASELRSPKSHSNSVPDRDSVMSTSSLPTRPKTFSDEWKCGMPQKQLPKTFYEPCRKFSNELEQPARQGWEWMLVLEGKWVKNRSPRPLSIRARKLARKRLRRSHPVRNTDKVYPSKTEDYTSKGLDEYAGNQDKKITTEALATLHDAECSFEMARRRGRLLRGFKYISPTYAHFRSPTGEPEGLYCKTRRVIGGAITGKSKLDASKLVLRSRDEIPSRATATLQGAANALDRSQKNATHPGIYSHTGGRSPSVASQRLGRQIGIAPWHRRNSQDSTWSVTSSIRDVLRGRTPTSSPNPEMQYGGNQGKMYAKVDITKKEQPTFLPSEAVQVQTPPVPSAGATNLYSRSSFLNLNPYGDEQNPNIVSGDKTLVAPAASQTAMKAHVTLRRKREWWDDVETMLGSDAPTIKAQIEPINWGQIEPLRFEWHTPEHLPNSPLCPNAKRNATGKGNGICVYHGRK